MQVFLLTCLADVVLHQLRLKMHKILFFDRNSIYDDDIHKYLALSYPPHTGKLEWLQGWQWAWRKQQIHLSSTQVQLWVRMSKLWSNPSEKMSNTAIDMWLSRRRPGRLGSRIDQNVMSFNHLFLSFVHPFSLLFFSEDIRQRTWEELGLTSLRSKWSADTTTWLKEKQSTNDVQWWQDEKY
jgi:hypothetical protein